MEDTVHFEVEQFNRRVITEPFNRAVLTRLAEYIDPTGKEKDAYICSNGPTRGFSGSFIKRSIPRVWG